MKKSSQFKMGILVGGVLTGVGLAALSAIRKQQREEIYREAELKAMDELDDMMVGSCADCDCAAECSAAKASEPADEAAEEPAEQ